ncbi:MAG: PTS transporter subunit EIIC [Propioniciclava sp.]|uniref:PTS sugar transporter subunit IIC n=1 Tax=Propioniciclava sp. TaxID=2038686 RepID=UPI0039E23437
MASVGDFINEKVLPPILRFVNTKPITALKNGMMFVMPLTIVGAIFLLLANFPIPEFVAWQKTIGIYDVFMQVYTATFNLLGVVACVGITYSWVRNEGYDALPAAVWSFCAMVMLLPLHVLPKGATEPVTGVIPLDWTSSKGMLAGILIAYFVSIVYCWFLKKNITIKMPDGVPPNVATAFTSLIPGTVILTLIAVVYGLFRIFDTSMVEAIYNAIQTPLMGVSDSLAGMLIVSFTGPFLWFFGVHGSSIVAGIMTPITLSNAQANQALIDSGVELTIANGGRIVTQQFVDNYVAMTGAGITIGLVVYMLVFAKSAQFKTLGRLGGAPAAFNINEPIVFGTPIVMNPLLLVPFFLTPMITSTLLYFAMSTGILPLFAGVIAPWTTPPILSGLIVGGWKHAVFQALILVLSVAIYYPFARKADLLAYADEQAAAAEHESAGV